MTPFKPPAATPHLKCTLLRKIDFPVAQSAVPVAFAMTILGLKLPSAGAAHWQLVSFLKVASASLPVCPRS